MLHTSNPSEALNAEFNVTLPAGSYYLSIQGTGFGNPPTDGYSDYGSLGYYGISGSFTGPELTALMEKIVTDGRSSAGAPQKNDVPVKWKRFLRK